MKILVDKGEPKEMYQKLRILNKQYDFGFVIVYENLEVGDYLVMSGNDKVGNISIERKSSGDYQSSIMDGRLLAQAVSMAENFDRAVIIIEGDIYKSYSKLNDNSKVGALGALITKYGVSVINTKNKDYTAFFILSILKHANMTIDFSKIFRPRANMEDREIGALSCAKGIGGGLAKKVLKYFRIRDVANIRDPKIIFDKVHGIGSTKAENLINLFAGFEQDPNFLTDIDVLTFEWYLKIVLNNYHDPIKDDFSKERNKMIKILKEYFDIKPTIRFT